MRRVCFDIDCNYFHDPLDGFLKIPEQARSYYRDKYRDEPCRFNCATIFDSSTRKYKDFTDSKKLFDYLVSADEIISFNGRIYDFIALENLVGEKAMKSLWRKPHHDLAGWKEWSLRSASFQALSQKLATSFTAVYEKRLAKTSKTYRDQSIAKYLAGTYRDVKFTYELFNRYRASGDTDHTFPGI